MNPYVEHLLLRLRPVHRTLRAAVDRRAAISERTLATDVDRVCVTTEDAVKILDYLHVSMYEEVGVPEPGALDDQEGVFEQRIRAVAAEAGSALPLDQLSQRMDSLDVDLVLAAIAPELDSGYELIFGFIVDDLDRRFPSVEALSLAFGGDVRTQLGVRDRLGPAGVLRRHGLLVAEQDGAPTERHVRLRPGPRLLPWLLGASGDPDRLFRDPGHVPRIDAQTQPAGLSEERFDAIARGLAAGVVDVVGLWGPAGTARSEVARVLAARADVPLRREASSPEETLRVASALGGFAWIETDGVQGERGSQRAAAIEAAILAHDVPVILTGRVPYRPERVLGLRRWVDQPLALPSWQERAAWWTRELPDLAPEVSASLASRLTLDPVRVEAAAQVARSEGQLTDEPATDKLEDAIKTVTQGVTSRFTTRIEPRRGPEDLVLPPKEHASVLEVVAFARASARVSDDWGLGRMLTGGGGIKALFTGDSGTGKTLAAEVIAGMLGMPLMRVDLAKVVSKWIGETEQNLEVAFSEAEACHAVIFFDEADGLFGKRGQVQKGTDRYANLEVNYLLQRLEDYSGVAILATNLRANIDKAFTRRFQVAVDFPRPGPAERGRIWTRAFPPEAPLAPEVDLEVLRDLEMTGAGIVASARTAALLAADRGADSIGMPDLVNAIARQFRQEARVLTTQSLGPWAELLVA